MSSSGSEGPAQVSDGKHIWLTHTTQGPTYLCFELASRLSQGYYSQSDAEPPNNALQQTVADAPAGER